MLYCVPLHFIVFLLCSAAFCVSCIIRSAVLPMCYITCMCCTLLYLFPPLLCSVVLAAYSVFHCVLLCSTMVYMYCTLPNVLYRVSLLCCVLCLLAYPYPNFSQLWFSITVNTVFDPSHLSHAICFSLLISVRPPRALSTKTCAGAISLLLMWFMNCRSCTSKTSLLSSIGGLAYLRIRYPRWYIRRLFVAKGRSKIFRVSHHSLFPLFSLSTCMVLSPRRGWAVKTMQRPSQLRRPLQLRAPDIVVGGLTSHPTFHLTRLTSRTRHSRGQTYLASNSHITYLNLCTCTVTVVGGSNASSRGRTHLASSRGRTSTRSQR
jgi:hypothetical protein